MKSPKFLPKRMIPVVSRKTIDSRAWACAEDATSNEEFDLYISKEESDALVLKAVIETLEMCKMQTLGRSNKDLYNCFQHEKEKAQALLDQRKK